MATFTSAKERARKARATKDKSPNLKKVAKQLKKLPTYKGTNLKIRTPYKILSSVKGLKKTLKKVRKNKIFCFDYEATGLQWHRPDFKPLMLSISYKEGYSDILPLYHFESKFSPQTIEQIIVPLLAEVFADPTIIKIAHNIKYDLHVSKCLGIHKFKGAFKCSMLLHQHYNENVSQSLKVVVPMYWPIFFGWEQELRTYQKANRLKWIDIPLVPMAIYAAVDTDASLRLYNKVDKELPKSVYKFYNLITLPVMWELLEAERVGMKVDRKRLEASIVEVKEILAKKEKGFNSIGRIKKFIKAKNRIEIEKLADTYRKKIETLKTEAGKARYKELIKNINDTNIYTEVNISSPKQVAELLYNKDYGLGLPPKIERGQEKLTTNKDYLQVLLPLDKSGIMKPIMAIRSVGHLLSTYMLGILEKLDEDDKVHTSFNQLTVTGRLSSSDPNLQNIPIRSKLDDIDAERVLLMIRKFFIPLKSNHEFLKFDYSQFELRIMAEFANEKVMIKAFKDGVDIHALTAASMLGITLKEFYKLPAKEQKLARFRAKAVNFGFIFGMFPKKFKEYAFNEYGWEITLEEATEYREGYFKLYPGLAPYHYKIIDQARLDGYVTTLFGRVRRLPNILSENMVLKIADEHSALNTPIQGTAAELTLLCIIELKKVFNKKKQVFINTIHDSGLNSVHRKLIIETAKTIKQIAENLPIKKLFGVDLKHVDLKIDLETGSNWGELKDLEL